MSKRKRRWAARIFLLFFFGIPSAAIEFGLYQLKVRHGWEIWPVNSHHIVFPIEMLLVYIVAGLVGISFFAFFCEDELPGIWKTAWHDE